jgi:hypothetical protein
MCLTLKGYLYTVLGAFAALAIFLEVIQFVGYVDVGCKTLIQILSYKLVCCRGDMGIDCKLINKGLLTSIVVPFVKKMWHIAFAAEAQTWYQRTF